MGMRAGTGGNESRNGSEKEWECEGRRVGRGGMRAGTGIGRGQRGLGTLGWDTGQEELTWNMRHQDVGHKTLEWTGDTRMGHGTLGWDMRS